MQCTKTLLNSKMTLPKSKKNADYSFLQEAAKESKAALLSPDDAEDAESPLPSNIIQPVSLKDKDRDNKDNKDNQNSAESPLPSNIILAVSKTKTKKEKDSTEDINII